MKKMIGLTGLALTTTILGASLAHAGVVTAPASSTVTNKTAAVTVLSPAIVLSNTESELNFGTVIKPASGSSTFITIDQDGAEDVASTADYVAGGRSGGEFTFTGDTALVTLEIEAGAVTNGLSLTNFTGEYGGDALSGGSSITATNLTGPGTGTDLLLGATLTLNNTSDAVTTGAQTVPYTITFTYE